MALIDKLNAIGDAIRVKTGKTDKLTLDQMPNEIASIQTGGGGTTPANPIIEALSVTENGTYTAPNGVDGYSPVTVNVPIPDGYIVPSGTLNITENGTYDVTEKASAVVSIPEKEIVLQDKTVKANGTYSADAGYDGLGQVTVNVPTGGGGGGGSDLPDGYERVDFIEFSGKQLVDTGFIGNQDTRIRTSFTWGSATQNHVFGCASSDNTASITSYMNGSWRFGSKSATKSINKNNTLLPYAAIVDKTTIGVTGSNTSLSGVNEFETIGTLLLGGARSSSGGLPGSGIVGRVFYFYLWQGETQVQMLIPVVSADGVYRFYDLISQTFFDSITDTPLDGGSF